MQSVQEHTISQKSGQLRTRKFYEENRRQERMVENSVRAKLRVGMVKLLKSIVLLVAVHDVTVALSMAGPVDSTDSGPCEDDLEPVCGIISSADVLITSFETLAVACYNVIHTRINQFTQTDARNLVT